MNQKGRCIKAGHFTIEELDSKIILKLKGDFDGNNTKALTLMIMKKSFCTRRLELDMSEVTTISSRDWVQLIDTLEILKERAIAAEITGLDGMVRQSA